MKKFLFVGLLSTVAFLLPGQQTPQVQYVQTQDNQRYEVAGYLPLFYEQLKESLTFPLAWNDTSGRSYAAWRVEVREVLTECMQLLPPAPASYDATVLATEKRNGYEARKLLFNVSAWSRIPAYLLVPQGKGPFPAVIMLHDHGAHFSIGKEKVIRPFGVTDEISADAAGWVEKCYDGQYTGDYFAENGYVVLAIDALFWGERGRKEGTDYAVQQALASNLLQMGTSWGGVIAMDDVRSAGFLAELPEVDPARIGSLGFSMGACRSWMLSALTDRVAAAAAVCWMNTTARLMTPDNNQTKGGSAYAMLIPGIRRFLDYPHVASVACPKPALFFNGSRDPLFPVNGVEEAYAEMERVWNNQQVPEKLTTRIWDETHFFNREMQRETLQFFDKWLKQ
ncbi:MAG: dienelactone hydrolase family protein [Culturomica sp.]|jgi:dienelactone hydrolase|nr:dienelactone hydrolase family protein [Culturomica sp.]